MTDAGERGTVQWSAGANFYTQRCDQCGHVAACAPAEVPHGMFCSDRCAEVALIARYNPEAPH